MSKVVYKSNGGAIGDGFRQARISEGGQKLEIMTDTKTGAYSEVVLVGDKPIDPPPGPIDPPPPVEPPATGLLTPSTFAAALATATGGEVLRLASGNYGVLASAAKFASAVAIVSADPALPALFTGLALSGAQGIDLVDLKFKYTWLAAHNNSYRVFRVDGCNGIRILDCEFEGDNRADGLPASDCLGISESASVVVRDSTLHGFRVGIHSLDSDDITIAGNDIYGMRSDGMIIVATVGITIADNHIHDWNGAPGWTDHRDGIQFFTNGAKRPSADITISNNTIDIGQGCYTQSVFMRNEKVDTGEQPDFFYRNVMIKGNKILNCQTHGITVGETDGLTVRGNVVGFKDDYNQDNAHNAAHFVKYPIPHGQLVPKINLAKASRNVVVEANTFIGAAWYTRPRVT